MTLNVWAGLSGCDDLSSVEINPNVDFELDIQPIFDAHCSFCHGGENPIAFMDLTQGYTDVVDVPSFQFPSFVRVKPGDILQSYLFFKINCGNQLFGGRMPLNAAPLNLQQQALIRDWINQLLIFNNGFE